MQQSLLYYLADHFLCFMSKHFEVNNYWCNNCIYIVILAMKLTNGQSVICVLSGVSTCFAVV